MLRLNLRHFIQRVGNINGLNEYQIFAFVQFLKDAAGY